MRRLGTLLLLTILALGSGPAPRPAAAVTRSAASPGATGGASLEWWLRELRNFADAYGRNVEQLRTPGFAEATAAEIERQRAVMQSEDAAEFFLRPRLTLTTLLTFPNAGDIWRDPASHHPFDLAHRRVYFANRYGAKLAGDLWGPPDLFASGVRRPAVVITDGSIQGNARMYWWAAQTLAQAGYVVLTYDVQGQGESETFPHDADGGFDFDPPAQPPDTPHFLREIGPLNGFPFQQPANFGWGAIDAHNFLLSTPEAPYEHFQPDTGTLHTHNPWHAFVEPERVGAAGHSLGAAAVSFVQAHPEYLRRPLRTIVAWDALSSCSYRGPLGQPGEECPAEHVNTPLVPALNLTNDYMLGIPFTSPPDPEAEMGAFRTWRAAGQDVASIALRAGTHLEYTSVPNVFLLGATRFGQDLAAHYTLAWFDRYLRDDPGAEARILTRSVSFRHRDPFGVPEAADRVRTVERFASFHFLSGVSLGGVCSEDWRAGTPGCP